MYRRTRPVQAGSDLGAASVKHPHWLPKKERLLQSRFIRPFAHHLDHPELWHLERESVARGAAVGLFFGVMIPVAQFLFAAIIAIFVRGNLAVAAAATLISNPLTFPPLYWAAYRLGQWMLRDRSAEAVAVTEAVAGAIALSAERATEARGWLEGAWYWITSAGAPLLVGLFTLATVASVVGYALVQASWTLGLILRQRARMRLRERAQKRRRKAAKLAASKATEAAVQQSRVLTQDSASRRDDEAAR